MMDWTKLITKRRVKKSKPLDIRNEFESDYGRVIFSHALRRMHDKTQVFPLTTDDNIHSRLTHSNEVMSLGYTFGLKLSKSSVIQKRTGLDELELMRVMPILMQTVCLIHDIGNAPFGHFGETIVSDFFKEFDKKPGNPFSGLNDWQKRDFLNYDGNAQGLRVITKLQYLDNPFGLNLTFASLGAFLKYPNHDEINSNVKKQLEAKGEQLKPELIEKSKHGVFFSEKDYFEMIVNECGLELNGRVLRHPLCYLMEAADSIAYLCMDMEDGFHKGLVSIVDIRSMFDRNESDVAPKVIEICDDPLLNDVTKMVNIRIKLIGYLVKLAYSNFENNLDKIESGEYNSELIKEDNHKVYELLGDCSSERIFTSRDINYLESTGYSVFKGLLEFYTTFLFHDNKKYRKRGISLISRSIIDAAIEENLVAIATNKVQAQHGDEQKEIQKHIDKYAELLTQQMRDELSDEDLKALREHKFEIVKRLKPKFEDLSNYFKLRVILDFISGMTDQFALTHYQKLSGQKIA